MKSLFIFSLALLAVAVPGSALTMTKIQGACTSAEAGLTSTIAFTGSSAVDGAGYATYNSPAYNAGTTVCGNDFLYQSSGIVTEIVFSTPISYFGLAWGTPDPYNSLQLFNGATQLGPTFTGLDLASSFTAGTFYVNFYAGAGEQITKVVLSSSGCCFETDNHSYRIAAIPEPGSFALLAVPALLLAVRRRVS